MDPALVLWSQSLLITQSPILHELLTALNITSITFVHISTTTFPKQIRSTNAQMKKDAQREGKPCLRSHNE